MKAFPFVFAIILLFMFSENNAQQCPSGGAAFINEFSGSTVLEYIELVVIGDPSSPTNPVDLEGWILDDNNIDQTGQGTASGHLILGDCFDAMIPGSIIVVYNSDFPHPGIVPGFPNADGAYVIPHSDPCISICTSNPSTSNSSYIPCNSSGYEGWSECVGLSTNGDGVQIRKPDASFYHGLYYNTNFGPSAEAGCLDVGNIESSLSCGDWYDVSNYSSLTTSPGMPNNSLNSTFIDNILAGNLDCDDFSAACIAQACPEIDDITMVTSICSGQAFDVVASGLNDMAMSNNGEADFGINFVLFDGGSEPADPYSGGTSMGIVSYFSLTGSDPDQSATLNTSISSAGTYQICAILDPESEDPDCKPYACETIEIDQTPIAEFSGYHNFCPGDCHKISLVIVGGSEPYDVSFEVSVGAINFPFDVDSYDVDNQTAICYTEGGIFPSYDPASNILSIPDFFELTASIIVTQIIDNNGCIPSDVDPNFVTIELNSGPEITAVDEYSLCDEDGDGIEWFDLESLNTQLNGGSGITVEWYEDADGNITITSPDNYLSGDATVYASLYDENCPSDTIPINLIVVPIPYPGEDSEIEICNQDNSILDFEIIVGGEDGGSWTDEDGAGVDIDDPGNVDFTDISPGSYLFSYTIPGDGICPENSAFLTVIVLEPLNAGMDNDAGLCFNSPVLVDLIDLLGEDVDLTGDWSDINGSGVDLNDPSQVDFSGVAVGFYQFEYTIVSDNACEDQTSVISIYIYEEPNPGIDNELSICNSVNTLLNIEGALGDHDLTGYWVDYNDSGVDMEDPFDVDFTGIAIGDYNYVYIIPEADGCPEASANILVHVAEVLFAGQDSSFQICEGSTDLFNLFDLITGEANNSGTWSNLSGGPVDFPEEVDLSTAGDGMTIFLYELESECGIDSAIVQIEVIDALYAGDDYELNICLYDTISLWDSLQNFEDGGIWYFNMQPENWYFTTDPLNKTFDSLGVFTFKYIISEEVGCYPDTAVAIINILDVDVFAGADSTLFVCQGQSWIQSLFDLIPGVSDSTGVWTQLSGNPKDISNPDDVIFENDPVGIDSFLYVLDGECGSDSSYAVIEVGTAPYAGQDYSLELCSDLTIINLYDSLISYNIGGNWYYMDGSNISDPVNFSIDAAGNHELMYVIPANGSCLADTAFANLTIFEAPNAGSGSTISYCEGHSDGIDLFSVLDDNPMLGGVWQSSPVIIDPANHNISNYTPGNYIIEYIVSGDLNAICPDDTSKIILEIKEAPNAGMNDFITLCNQGTGLVLDLNALLGEHDDNGYWIDVLNSGVNLTDSTQVDFFGIDPGIYTYTYLIEAQNSCPESQAELSIEIIEFMEAGSNHSLGFCEGDIQTIDLWQEMDPGISTYGSWLYSGQNNLDFSNPTSISLTELEPGEHTIWYILNENGPCNTDSASLLIIIDEIMETGSCDTLFVCNGSDDSSLNFLSELNGHDVGGQFRELTNSGVEISDPSNVLFTDALEGRYIFEYFFPANGNCPEQSTRIYIDVFPSYEMEMTMAICPGESFQIGNNVYDINNLQGEENLQTVHGCDSLIQINLTEKQIDFWFNSEDANCHGYGEINIDNTTNIALPVTLDHADLGLVLIDIFPYTLENVLPGIYSLNLVDARSCEDQEQVTIHDFENFSSDLEEEVSIYEGESYQINLNTDINPEMISWWPTDHLSCGDCINPLASPDVDTEYIVTMVDKDDCVLTDTILIRVLKDSKVHLPNAFSPNSDEFNPTFYPISNSNQGYYNMRIYDRWGEEIFVTENSSFNDQYAGWDGRYNDKLLNPGVYVYLIEIYFTGKEKQVIAGDVLLLR